VRRRSRPGDRGAAAATAELEVLALVDAGDAAAVVDVGDRGGGGKLEVLALVDAGGGGGDRDPDAGDRCSRYPDRAPPGCRATPW
jgi:hypothetical protein